MQYSDIHKAVFLERPNRFIAHCTVDGMLETVHVKNTGRCRELLVPGATVYLEKSSNPNRKTAYDLVTVETPFGLVNMDAAAPNQVAGELLRAGAILSSPTLVQPEVRFGASRLDFYAENDRQRLFVEVKGVTHCSGHQAHGRAGAGGGAGLPCHGASYCADGRVHRIPTQLGDGFGVLPGTA